MAATYFYETQFEIGSKTVLVFAEYTLTGGCPAHYGSLTYPGHPAESADLEFIKIEINTTDDDPKTAKPENYFAAPDWLVTILSNDDEFIRKSAAKIIAHPSNANSRGIEQWR
jgi:hypothetical protein